MNKKEADKILKAKQMLDSALEYLNNDRFEQAELQVTNVKDILAVMIGEAPETDS